jgi:CheY-like chemotaxis protein
LRARSGQPLCAGKFSVAEEDVSHKILLADDSVTVQKIVTLTFSDEGVDVAPVNNGDEAIMRLQYMRPDLIMADVSLPGKNGYEICEFVKSHAELKHTPVILLVPAFEPFDEERAARVGADHHLTKPFQSIRTLISTVKDLIEPQLAWPASPMAEAEDVLDVPAPSTAELRNLPSPEEPLSVTTASLAPAATLEATSNAAPQADTASLVEQDDAMLRETMKLPDVPPLPAAAAAAPVFEDFDDILELDDVFPPASLVVAPPPPQMLAPLPQANTITQAVKLTSVEAITTTSIPQNVIDEIAARVTTQVTAHVSAQFAQFAAQLYETLSARLAQELAPRVAGDVASRLAPARNFVPDPLRENGDSLLDI